MDHLVDADRLRRLQAVTDAALSHLRLDDLLAALLVRTRDALEVDTAAILLLDAETNELVARAALGIEEEVEQGVRIPVGGGFAGRVAAERQPVVLPKVQKGLVLNSILLDKGIASLLGVPLIVEGNVLGVMHVGTLTPRDFGVSDIEFLQIVADRAALAIEHARAYEAELAARERLENLQAVTDAALSHLELEELLAVLLRRIRDILRADTCAILLLDEEADELVARAAVGIEEEVEHGVRIPMGEGFAGRVAAERRPVVLSDVDHSDVLNPILREKGIKSLLGAPLLVRGEPLGIVHVGTLTPREFTKDDAELLVLAAERAAMAIEKASLHDEVVRLDQMKLNFVAVASHELRTPATSVYGLALTLRARQHQLSQEQVALLIDTLASQSDRLRRLIEQLLDLSRLDASAIPIEPRAVDLHAVVRDVVAAIGPEVEVRVEVEPGLEAHVDPLAVERVVSNLVGNAIRYGQAPVIVSAEQRDRHLRIAVEDSGGGVPEELVPRLFERFERGDAGQGAGLGLAIARAYARAHGGDLLYDPRSRGARFELVLPRQR